MEKIDIAIIGAGAVGCAVALELASRGKKNIFLFERGRYLAEGQSGRNSGVIHAGIYYDHGTLKARLCVEGNRLMYEFCGAHDVPVSRTGKLTVAPVEEEEERITPLFERAVRNNVEGARLVGPDEIKKLEPNVKATMALYTPTTGSLDSAGYVKTLARLAEEKGVTLLMQAEVVNITAGPVASIVEVKRADGRIEEVSAGLVINAAGLYSDHVAKMIDPAACHALAPLRGEYFKFNKARRADIAMRGLNVYPAPDHIVTGGVTAEVPGIHLTPTFALKDDGNSAIGNIVTVGPQFTAVTDREDFETDRKPVSLFLERAGRFFPGLKLSDLEMDFTGIMATLGTGKDWIIERCARFPNCIQLIGLDSPALTSSLAIARHVANMI